MFYLFVLLMYLAVAAFAYGKLPATFFQQDEWAIFSNFLYWQKAGLSWFERLFFYGGVTHLIPLANIFAYIQFTLFGLTFAPYALVSIALHIINAYLVTVLVRQLEGSKIVSVLTGLLFLINPTTHQAVTWIATAPGTVPSVTFVLLTLIFFLRKQTILWIVCFIAALGFKESSVFLFLYLPSVGILASKSVKQRLPYGFFAVIVLGLFYLSLRLAFRVFGPQNPAAVQIFAQPLATTYLYRLLTHPFKAFSQSLIPQEIIIGISNTMMKLAYPWLTSGDVPDPYVAQSVGVDIVSYALSLALFGPLFIIRKSLALTASLIFAAMSVAPLIVIPGAAGYISLFDGRHLYMTSIGVSAALAVALVTITKKLPLLRLGVAAVTGVYVLSSIWYIRGAIHKQAGVAATRKAILKKITTWYPGLTPKALVVTQSDKAYYGLPPEETILPFQSGFGNTLLVWYDMHGENLPACFFEQKFLYELTSEDYRECEGRGFGYFRHPVDTSTIMNTYHLTPDSLFAFSYTYVDNAFVDATAHMRASLAQ